MMLQLLSMTLAFDDTRFFGSVMFTNPTRPNDKPSVVLVDHAHEAPWFRLSNVDPDAEDPADPDGEPRSVAVKFLQPDNFHPGLVEREIAGLTDISSRRIMGLHEVRTTSIAGTDYTALLCECLPGGSVQDNLAADGVPGYVDALAFAIELLHAVTLLHAAERVHRDLKPENIMLRNGSWDSPVLIDLGLSKAATETTMTRYPQRVGSLLFMAPEQLRGERARKSSDLWACGVILFTVLTGEHPYITSLSGKSEDEVAEEITGPPRALPAHIPDALRDVVLRLLSEDAFERGTAKRALKDLRKAAK